MKLTDLLPAHEQYRVNFATGYADLEYLNRGTHSERPMLELHFICSTEPGGGTKVMNEILELADKYQLQVHLFVYPLPGYARKQGLRAKNRKELTAWYGRFGFVSTSMPVGGMTRYPK